MSEWQLIESAPRDGTPILACTLYDGFKGWAGGCWAWPVTVCWASYHPNAKGKETWRTSPVAGNKMESVTHWMPLPEAPSE